MFYPFCKIKKNLAVNLRHHRRRCRRRHVLVVVHCFLPILLLILVPRRTADLLLGRSRQLLLDHQVVAAFSLSLLLLGVQVADDVLGALEAGGEAALALAEYKFDDIIFVLIF
jgi:hypothetical protein